MKNKEQREGNKFFVYPIFKGLSEKIEKECKVIKPEKLKLAFWPNKTRQTLVQVKNKISPPPSPLSIV